MCYLKWHICRELTRNVIRRIGVIKGTVSVRDHSVLGVLNPMKFCYTSVENLQLREGDRNSSIHETSSRPQRGCCAFGRPYVFQQNGAQGHKDQRNLALKHVDVFWSRNRPDLNVFDLSFGVFLKGTQSSQSTQRDISTTHQRCGTAEPEGSLLFPSRTRIVIVTKGLLHRMVLRREDLCDSPSFSVIFSCCLSKECF